MASILLYTLHLNTAFLDAFSPDAPSAQQTAMREASVYARGLDLFNEYGVQIVTPNYEADPPAPMVVPKAEWFAAPARPEPNEG